MLSCIPKWLHQSIRNYYRKLLTCLAQFPIPVLWDLLFCNALAHQLLSTHLHFSIIFPIVTYIQLLTVKRCGNVYEVLTPCKGVEYYSPHKYFLLVLNYIYYEFYRKIVLKFFKY